MPIKRFFLITHILKKIVYLGYNYFPKIIIPRNIPYPMRALIPFSVLFFLKKKSIKKSRKGVIF
ncbi:hypothetical protein BCAMP_09800 [Brochothrix campestris FSL F6-1037]|uniref:Uncharacterized protein n=1 Tax=Brochothrix campestris FSL F6-1037 TaxID=1265861 RepID=W7CPL8_9LIST|nr:hypothetical protein BCAMP_09800 [Brochothrix campestris FSL F6-1037]